MKESIGKINRSNEFAYVLLDLNNSCTKRTFIILSAGMGLFEKTSESLKK